MPESSNPAAYCTLSAEDLKKRRAELNAGLVKKIAEVREIECGYALRFEPAPGIVEEVARFIEFERGCCSFLDFGLRVEKGDGPVWLDLTGAEDAQEFLKPLIARWTS